MIQGLAYHLTPDPVIAAAIDLSQRRYIILVEKEVIQRLAYWPFVFAGHTNLARHEQPPAGCHLVHPRSSQQV